MRTDIPLKRLTHLCPSDILALLGRADATVLKVETLELPASSIRLDTVLHLVNTEGLHYLLLVEWQGYPDKKALWRILRYAGWLGEHYDERPILIMVVYLKPDDDVGDTLVQQVDGLPGWMVQLPCVRLWEMDAAAAVASGLPGLITLAPLMAGATTELVETAAQTLLTTVAPPVQGELLAALGVFSEPLLDTERFIRLVTKERLMATGLISYLFKEQTEEFAQKEAEFTQKEAEFTQKEAEFTQKEVEFTQKEAELAQQLAQKEAELAQQLAQKDAQLAQEKEAQLQAALQQTVVDAIVVRFPDAPLRLARAVRQVTAPDRLLALHQAVLTAADLATVEQLLEKG